MLNKKTFLCVIPARGNSKGVKDKNLKPLLGKPLIGWGIDAAKKSGIFDLIVVYSDCPKIRKYAESRGVLTLEEPRELAQDHSLVADAMVDCLSRITPKYDYAQLMQATSPGVRPQQIEYAARQILGRPPYDETNICDFVIGVHPYKDPTIVVKGIPGNLSLKGWYPDEFKDKNRQDFPPAYRLNGYIYLGKWDIFAERKDWWEQDIRAYICSEHDDIDIDTKWDWEWAELKLSVLKGKK